MVGALGLVGTVLALAALAHVRASTRPAAESAPQPPAMQAHARVEHATPQPKAVEALRDGAPLDLNRARAGDLELLPGIGPKLAQRILDDRSTHGPYRSVDQLVRVRGIGRRTLQRLRPLVRVDAAGQGPSPIDTAGRRQ